MTGDRQIVVAAAIEYADRPTRDAAVAASVEVQAATRRDEPGCLAYCFGPDPAEDRRVQVYELWADQAALAAHFEHPNYLQMGELLRSFGITWTENRKFEVARSEPVYDDQRRPRADFTDAAAEAAS